MLELKLNRVGERGHCNIEFIRTVQIQSVLFLCDYLTIPQLLFSHPIHRLLWKRITVETVHDTPAYVLVIKEFYFLQALENYNSFINIHWARLCWHVYTFFNAKQMLMKCAHFLRVKCFREQKIPPLSFLESDNTAQVFKILPPQKTMILLSTL